MNYTKEDIKFEQITPRGFENLCYDLLISYNFRDVIWRQGGADNGRDIEANYTFIDPIMNRETRWFFECKHYTEGVPPDVLNSKIAWADAELPHALVIFVSSYLTNNARTWLESIQAQKYYEIVCIEGEQLKDRLIKYPDLVERYFALDRYEQMLKDIKDYKSKFNINPSFEILKEIIENINLAKLDTEDFGFILLNFYGQYKYFESRNEHFGDFEPEITYRILDYLKGSVSKEELSSFKEYKENYDELGGVGMFDEMQWIADEDSDNMENYNFQCSDLHLNNKQSQDKWKVGYYLFIIHGDVAFEIFKVEKTEIRIIRNFTPQSLRSISLNFKRDIVTDYQKYLKHFMPQ